MSTLLQFAAVTILGLVTAWLVGMWNGLFQNSDVAFVGWIAGCLAIGFLVDRWQARRRRDMPGSQERGSQSGRLPPS